MAAISYGENGAMLKNTNKQHKQSHTSLEKKKNYSIPQKQCFPASPSLDVNVINGSNQWDPVRAKIQYAQIILIDRYRERERGVLGGRGGFFFEPMADVLDVAPKDGGRLFDIAPQQ